MNKKINDQEIILKIKSGEIDLFKIIVDRYYDYIFLLIKKKIFNLDDAEDLIQNVFISFYKSIENFDEKKPIKPYLYTIALNELKMFYRQYIKTLRLNENIEIEDKKTIEEFYQEEDFIFLDFNDKEKKIIQLLIEGYHYQEISKKLKIPLNTVKSIIRRLRLKIQKKNYEK